MLGLLEGILPGGAVQHKQNLLRRLRMNLLHHFADLRELVHQPHPIVEPSGGVDDDHVCPIRLAVLDGVIGD